MREITTARYQMYGVVPAPISCPSDPDEVAEAYIMGTLADADALAFEEHTLTCDRCIEVLRECDAFVTAMRSAARETATKARSEPIIALR